MQKKQFRELVALLEDGNLAELSEKLHPYLQEGDLDARFLQTHFSIEPALSGEKFDQRSLNELKALVDLRHPASIHAMAWKYRHGDGVGKDNSLFIHYLIASSLLGHESAANDLRTEIKLELGWEDFVEE